MRSKRNQQRAIRRFRNRRKRDFRRAKKTMTMLMKMAHEQNLKFRPMQFPVIELPEYEDKVNEVRYYRNLFLYNYRASQSYIYIKGVQ